MTFTFVPIAGQCFFFFRSPTKKKTRLILEKKGWIIVEKSGLSIGTKIEKRDVRAKEPPAIASECLHFGISRTQWNISLLSSRLSTMLLSGLRLKILRLLKPIGIRINYLNNIRRELFWWKICRQKSPRSIVETAHYDKKVKACSTRNPMHVNLRKRRGFFFSFSNSNGNVLLFHFQFLFLVSRNARLPTFI